MSIISIFGASYCDADLVARRVADALGYKYIDQEVVDWAAQRFDVAPEKLLRAIRGSSSVLEKFVHEGKKRFAYLKAAIAEHVMQDNVVYHGFLGHFLNRDISHVLKVCLFANRDFRVAKAAEAEGLSIKRALKKIRKYDDECRRFTRRLFDLDPWEEELYDIRIPMDSTSVDDAVKLICERARDEAFQATPLSQRAMEEFAFAAKVNIALAEHGHDADVLSEHGHITIFLNTTPSRPDRLKDELFEIASKVDGVKSVNVLVKPEYEQELREPAADQPSKVLLVDDEREFVQTLSVRLQMRDLSSAVAYDGEEALSYVEQEEPEVMILDLRMPGIDGVEVLRRVKKTHPNVEVIILTGHGTEKDEALTREMGAFAYLEKPVEIDELARTVRQAYEKINREKAERQRKERAEEEHGIS